MAKHDLNAQAVAHAKYSLWVKKTKLPKTWEKRFYKHIQVVLFKKWVKKQLVLEI